MTYVPNRCPDCGASLDPGEVCDCIQDRDGLESYLDEGDGDG